MIIKSIAVKNCRKTHCVLVSHPLKNNFDNLEPPYSLQFSKGLVFALKTSDYLLYKLYHRKKNHVKLFVFECIATFLHFQRNCTKYSHFRKFVATINQILVV